MKTKTKYLVLSDIGKNRRYKTLKRAKQDHDRRRLNAKDDGVQLWREYPTYDLLIFSDGRDVRNQRIKSFYSLLHEKS